MKHKKREKKIREAVGDRKEEMGIGMARLLSAWNGRGERPVCCLKRVCGRARECNSNPCSSKICADLYVHTHTLKAGAHVQQ